MFFFPFGEDLVLGTCFLPPPPSTRNRTHLGLWYIGRGSLSIIPAAAFWVRLVGVLEGMDGRTDFSVFFPGGFLGGWGGRPTFSSLSLSFSLEM
jgi:hypothetical protein